MNCPECGHNTVKADFTCHTYGGVDADGKERWYSCIGCGSAIEYFCTCWLEDMAADEHYLCNCTWKYTHGLNPKNPRAAYNETFRPAWLERKDPDERVEMPKHPDVPWLGEKSE